MGVRTKVLHSRRSLTTDQRFRQAGFNPFWGSRPDYPRLAIPKGAGGGSLGSRQLPHLARLVQSLRGGWPCKCQSSLTTLTRKVVYSD